MKIFITGVVVMLALAALLLQTVFTKIDNAIAERQVQIITRFESNQNVYCKSDIFGSKKYIVSKATGYVLVGKQFVNTSTDYAYDLTISCFTTAN